MFATVIAQLITWALKIKNQTVIAGNTETLVGGLFEQIVMLIKSLADAVANLVVGWIWQNPVNNVSDLATTYPNPKIGYAAYVRNANVIYVWNGTAWVNSGIVGFPSNVITTDNLSQIIDTSTIKAPSNKSVYDALLQKANISQVIDSSVTNSPSSYVVGLALAEKTDKQEFYNVSRATANYAFTTKILARNAVISTRRAIGQIIAYKLSSGVWVLEQFKGTLIADWAVAANWSNVGLAEEDIHQLLDDTTNKPISPKGVKNGLLSISGISYKQSTTTPAFIDLIPAFNYVTGAYIANNGAIINSGNPIDSYNAEFTPVTGSKTYLHTNSGNAVLFYAADKSTILGNQAVNRGGSFTTPVNCAFVRYNWSQNFVGNTYIYEAPITTTSSDLAVQIDLTNINGATESDAQTGGTSNMLPPTGDLLPNALNIWNNAVISDNGFKHTDYISVRQGTSYVSDIPPADPAIWFYDANKRPIKYVAKSTPAGTPFSFETPVNCAYIRVNIREGASTLFYLRQGSAGGNFYIPNLVVPRGNIVDIEDLTGEVINAIPYTEGTRLTGGTQYFFHSNQATIKGKYIKSIKLKTAAVTSIKVGFAVALGSQTVVWSKTFTTVVGLNTLEINRTLPAAAFLGVSGSYYYKEGAVNPVGGTIYGVPNTDLCVGIDIINSSSTGRNLSYTALGDSITIDSNSYANLLNVSLQASAFSNLAVGGLRCTGDTGLISKIALVPNNFVGLITIMIGINDSNNNVTLGSSAAALAKPFNDLNVNTDFAEAFRKCLETLLVKAPDAIVLVIPPLKSSQSTETRIESFRQVQRDICKYYSIPYTNTFEVCTIAPFSYTRLMPDGLHPNAEGHRHIERVLLPVIEMYIKQ